MIFFFLLLLFPTLCTGQWIECDGVASVKGGSCNNAGAPCQPGSGVFNAGKVTDIETCEGICEQPQHPGCVAVQFHGAHAGAWAGVCLLSNQSAWHPTRSNQAHDVACIQSDNFPACKCAPAPPPSPPSPGPQPPPPPPAVSGCITARLAYAKAQQALQGRANVAVYRSLDAWMQISSCANATALPDLKLATPKSYVDVGDDRAAAVQAASVYVSPSGSDGAGAGTASSPYQTLHKAQAVVRAMSAADRAGAVVNVMEGSYYLGEVDQGTLVFTSADSGADGAPVTWQAYPAGAKVVITGGVKLDCTWKPVQPNAGVSGVQACSVPPSITAIDSLFVDGLRQVRARYPNGDPLKPSDGYSSGAHATSQSPHTYVPVPKNVQVLSTDGNLIAKGSVRDGGGGNNFTIKTADLDAFTDGPRNVVTVDQAYTNGSRFNDTFNLPYWDTTNTMGITVPTDWQNRKWAKPAGAVVKMMHPAAWGSWAFEVGSYADGNMEFSKGGFQEARGNGGTGKLYIENLKEELDAANEFYFDAEESMLYYKPAGTNATGSSGEFGGADTLVEVPVLPRIIQFRGSVEDPAHHIAFVGMNISRSTPTYLESYEAPSGGDWSIHRGGAVFLHGAESIVFEQVKFDQLDGNGVFLSSYAKNNAILDCDFWRTGDTAVAAVGVSQMMNGTAPTYPSGNVIQGNHFDTVGIMMKQTSCYFKAITYNNSISNNICHDGPRAGINFNDGFMGGDTLKENVIWAMVRETGDHGTFNSWDRREWFYPCPENPAKSCFMPKVHKVSGNMFIGPAGWNMDHDDGSSQYHDFNNIVYLGGYKYRDGINRNMSGNLMLEATPKFQVFGFEWDFYVDNYLVGQKSSDKSCGPSQIGSMAGNTYVTVASNGDEPVGGSVPSVGGNSSSRGRRQQGGCWPAKQVTMTVAQVEALGRGLIGLP